MNAYTINEGDGELATINFCDQYFNMQSLSSAIAAGKGSTNPVFKYNLNNYDQNPGRYSVNPSRTQEQLPTKKQKIGTSLYHRP
jgi:hypothetical protein